ncbi:MAG TPA: efflux RND transporter periplasmic adaptor subunit [Candidatus Dormibacteraeota bacterium]|jgi:multidrug resistance efflux pump
MAEQDDQLLNDRVRAHLDRVTKLPAPVGLERRLMDIATEMPPPAWRRRFGRLATGTAVVVAFAGVVGVALWTHQGGHAGPAAAPGAGSAGITAAGVTVPVSVGFRDLVTGVAVRAGDHVRRGQPLLSLDPGMLREQGPSLTAQIALLNSEIQAAKARVTATANQDSAHATVLWQEINTYQYQAAIVQQQLDLAEGRATEILTPIDGVIGKVSIQPGAFASPGQVLLTVLDLSHVQVTIDVPNDVTSGTPADITVDKLPGVALHGQVVAVEPTTTGSGSRFTATVDAPNTSGERVVPGLRAWVRFTSSSANQGN